MGLNQTPNYPNLNQTQIEIEQILYRHPYNQIFVYARVHAQNIPGLSANARGSIPQICVRTTCHCSFTPHASQEEERCRYEGCWRLKDHHTKMAWSHYKIESFHGVIFTLPTNKMLNFWRIDNSYMKKMFLAMWSFIHWQGDTSKLDAHFLIIALEIGTSWIFHLSTFTLL